MTLNEQSRSNILVGNKPLGIAVDEDTNKIYVAVNDLNHVAVIDGNFDRVLYYIPTGNGPTDLALHDDLLFVTNKNDDSVSMVHLLESDSLFNGFPFHLYSIYNNKYSIYKYYFEFHNDTKIVNIPVGDRPSGIDTIEIDTIEEKDGIKLYVANSGSNTVSVINIPDIKNPDIKNITINDIEVGLEPYDIAINDRLEKVYVVNKGSNSISVIDPNTEELVTGVKFNINPLGSGSIRCGTDSSSSALTPVLEYFYLKSNSECMALPNKGYEFVNWEKNLPDTSGQLITIQASVSENIWDYLRDSYHSIAKFFAIPLQKDESTLNITEFGDYTANFKESPPPLPADYWVSLSTIVATALIGSIFIPAIVSWFKSRNQTTRLNSFHKEMTLLQKNGSN